MKRIFIVQNTPLNEPLPLSVYLTSLLKNFSKTKEFEINLIIGKSKNIPIEINNLCNKIYQINSDAYSIKDNLNFSFKTKSILKKENKQGKIDIVHCFYPNSSLSGAVLFKKLNNLKAKIIYDVRSPWIEMSIERGFVPKGIAKIYKNLLYSEEKYLCKAVGGFIFITDGLKKYYLDKCKIKNENILVSPTGVDKKLFRKVKTNIRERYNIKKDEILIGSIGGIAKIRKLNKFLLIFKEASQKNPKLKLMFVGEGDDLKELKQKTEELNLKNKVIFVGKIPHKEVPKYISAFDFGLSHIPNIFIYENSFPLKILEYLACGIPVLASELKAHHEISKKLKGIFIYHNANNLLEFLKKNKKIKIRLKEYSWRNIAKKYKSIWRVL
jgi:glycosyltransferase involved in cell wall biosynthesis